MQAVLWRVCNLSSLCPGYCVNNRYATIHDNCIVDGWAIRSTHRFFMVRWFRQLFLFLKWLEQKCFTWNIFLLRFFAFFSDFCILRSNRGVQNTAKMPVFCSTNIDAEILLYSAHFHQSWDCFWPFISVQGVTLNTSIYPKNAQKQRPSSESLCLLTFIQFWIILPITGWTECQR